MKGKLLKILIAVFAVALIAPAFSAVENVKVGGDIAIYGVLRGDFDIANKNEDIHFFQTSARVYISADLSNNVSTMIRLINERNWDAEDVASTDVDLDVGYIQVKDLLTPGLNLTVGRQEIQLGEGLVVGSRYNAYTYPVDIKVKAADLQLRKAFDAVKLDYKASNIPLSVTAFLSKLNEKYLDDKGEETLYGLNLGYKIAEIADLEVYYVRDITDSSPKKDKLDTAGIRVVSKIPALENLNLKGEYAKQFGEDSTGADYEGSALLVGGSYKLSGKMEPAIKVNYLLLSGNDSLTKNENWVDVAPSNIGSRIGPLFYAYDAYNGSNTNGLKVLNLGLSLKPVEKLALSVDGYLLKSDEKVGAYDDIGTEITIGLEYKQTEDLTLGLTLSKLLADDLIEKGLGGDDAWQAIASMKLAF
jgi:predicted porin